MGARVAAVFAAFFLIFLSGAGWASHGAAEGAASAQAGREANTLASLQSSSPSADPMPADELATPADLEVEGSIDLPDVVQQFTDAWVAAPCRVRPGPHRVVVWRAPVLDGLHRPPRRLPATA